MNARSPAILLTEDDPDHEALTRSGLEGHVKVVRHRVGALDFLFDAGVYEIGPDGCVRKPVAVDVFAQPAERLARCRLLPNEPDHSIRTNPA